MEKPNRQGEGGGRPRKWATPEELELDIAGFWNWCEEEGKRPTVTRLAVYLDTDRKTLISYQNADNLDDRFVHCSYDEKRKYVNAVKRAKARIEAEYEDALFNKGETIGAIFTLKNNYDWKDKQELVTTNNNIEVTLDD